MKTYNNLEEAYQDGCNWAIDDAYVGIEGFEFRCEALKRAEHLAQSRAEWNHGKGPCWGFPSVVELDTESLTCPPAR